MLLMSTPLSFLDAASLLDRFGGSFIWLSAALLLVECGLLFPFLPGDSLLFAVGLFVAGGQVDVLGSSVPGLELVAALAVLAVAALAGNLVGYEIGRALGPRVYGHTGRLVSRALLDRARTFLELRGGPTLVVARFVPFVRTYVTLVAGITRLDRRRFVTASAVGAVLWTATITLLGFFLGSVPWVGDNIDVAITALALFTVAPVALEAARRRWRHRHPRPVVAEPAPVASSWRLCG
ncbi:VTT domain-containing protein [Nocardioides sp. KIGAM211]|uniref:VTT domain-containing protein n=2 Tax=Nocardioides luti TaxID=2761101 RepID=A0A7X0VB10_9ACTN|nr:VTT domain-containing protein [Nocardioides luti]MBB6627900.1 VTT domain-containing protein [Nocardioides luti]